MESRIKRDVAGSIGYSLDGEIYSIEVTLGIQLDDYDHYLDVKKALPNIEYSLAYVPPELYKYEPDNDYDSNKRETINLAVSIEQLQC